MQIVGMRHRQTGLMFEEWLQQLSRMPPKDPIGLMDIEAALREGFAGEEFGQKQWIEGMRLCLTVLLQRGWRPLLYDNESNSWQWTDRFSCLSGFGEGPAGVAEAIVVSWQAFGDSGGAKDLWFATRLPTPA